MKLNGAFKKIAAGALVAAALAIPISMAVLGSVAKPTMSVEGAELKTMPDGSVQMLVTIYMADIENCNSSRFSLYYNEDYMSPSDHTTNAVIGSADQGAMETDTYFEVDPALYGVDGGGTPKNPFYTTLNSGNDPGAVTGRYYSIVDRGKGNISLILSLNHTELKAAEDSGADMGKLVQVATGESDTDFDYVFNAGSKSGTNGADERVALGTMSFQVKPEYVATVSEKFSGKNDVTAITNGNDFLLKLDTAADSETWRIGFYSETQSGGAGIPSIFGKHENYSSKNPSGARFLFSFNLAKEIISIEATERSVLIDAYQAYSGEGKGDIALALRKFSPTVTATYTDGSRAVYVMPWGEADSKYGYGVYAYDPATKGKGAPITAYDPTGRLNGDKTPDYVVEQYYYYEDGTDLNGDPVYTRYPVPISVKLAVTPITLTGVSAEELEKTYVVDDNLVKKTVRTVTDLRLPAYARLATDVTPDGASLTLKIPGWTPANALSTWPVGGALNSLVADGTTDVVWPTANDKGTLGNPDVLAKRVGTYRFVVADGMGGTARPLTKADIQGAYPWLTVPDDVPALTAVRRLVEPGRVTEASSYVVTHVSTETDGAGQPALKLRVGKGNGTPTEHMDTATQLRIRLPDGTELGNGLNIALSQPGSVTTPDWFADKASNQGDYKLEQNNSLGDSTSIRGFDVTVTPGTAAGAYAQQRELLRRYVNLGGWFYVSVNEDPALQHWSDFIPVYVRPRANLHTANGEYNFIGDNVELFNYPGGFGKTIILPQGEFVPLNHQGELIYRDTVSGKPIYVTSDGTETTDPVTAGVVNRLKTDRFGVQTTYDGATGAEPGELLTFTVEGGPTWTTPSAGQITSHGKLYDTLQYGADAFLNGGVYPAYGTVYNGGTIPQRATIRVQKDVARPAQAESVKLSYGGSGNVSTGADGNVDLATFDTQKEGYTSRQEYTLTITNTGATPIYGLAVDTETDVDGEGSNFTLLKKPAAFLAPGQSTTFTLSYEYDLANRKNQPVLEYIDKLFITSASHPDSGAGADHLLSFDAKFMVSDSDVHRVTVNYMPADKSMGTAGTIVGEVEHTNVVVPTPDDPRYAMDYTSGSYTYAKDNRVYIVATPEDEYEVAKITYTYPSYGGDPSGSKDIIPTIYAGGTGESAGVNPGSAALMEGTNVYYFDMPADDVTVTVTYTEPLSSKLRLSDLKVYADTVETGLKPDTPSPKSYQVYQKSFTAEEEAAADLLDDRNLYLMQHGTAEQGAFDSKQNQYLVVIPWDAKWAQVEATLRKVVLLSAENKAVDPRVTMTLYETDITQFAIILDGEQGHTNDGPGTPPAYTGPTTHLSPPFASPEQGKSKYVRITVDGTENGQSDSRSYYVEVHRAARKVEATLHYGNSPVGMIMNAANITQTEAQPNKTRAASAFEANSFRFNGLSDAYIPAVVKGTALEQIHYWSEAWVLPGAVYEPESGTGGASYDRTKNLDLNAEAFFALSTQGFTEPGLKELKDNSGRPVDLKTVRRYVDVLLLTDGTAVQRDRFAGPDPTDPDQVAAQTVRIDLGTADVAALPADWCSILVPDMEADGVTQKKDAEGNPLFKKQAVQVRPGVYDLVYQFVDFDGTTDVDVVRPYPEIDSVTRPFVILDPVGDVNGDRTVTNNKTAPAGAVAGNDEQGVKDRVTNPLGYEADFYDDGNVFKYRVCDTNNDRNINNIDANELHQRPEKLPVCYYLPDGYR